MGLVVGIGDEHISSTKLIPVTRLLIQHFADDLRCIDLSIVKASELISDVVLEFGEESPAFVVPGLLPDGLFLDVE